MKYAFCILLYIKRKRNVTGILRFFFISYILFSLQQNVMFNKVVANDTVVTCMNLYV